MSTSESGPDVSRDDEDLVGSGSSVWADQPSASRPVDGVSQVMAQFDDFDPFKPQSTDDTAGFAEDVPPKPVVKNAPPTPSKPRAFDREKVNEASPASAIHDLASSSMPPSEPGPSTPVKEKGAWSQPMSAALSGSGSGIGNPFSSLASAFRRGSASGAAPDTPTSRPTTPLPPAKPAPAILIRDDDATADIDESEKSAPPAIPSQTGSNSTDVAGDGPDGDGEGSDVPQFDFNLFLEQMRSRSADPIAKYLRSFLKEFGKRQWSVAEQIRVINDFLDFIAVKMKENEVWKQNSDKEFDNAVEAMEKLVMNRVYHLTFIPALSPQYQSTTQTDDLERDHVLSQRIKLFGWVNETHLDLPRTDDNESFVDFARQELLKVNTYKAPRDKLICLLNCCKVIFGLMRHLNREDGADTFIPFLILVVLRSNPPNLISNIQYIQRFRNPERLAGENGYYLSSLNGAISFIETMDSSSLSNIDQKEFENKVEEAIAALPAEEESRSPTLPAPPRSPQSQRQRGAPSSSSATPRTPPRLVAPAHSRSHSTEDTLRPGQYQGDLPPRSVSPAEATRDFFVRSSDNLQKTVSKPLQALGRIFTEMGSDSEIVGGGLPSERHAPWPQANANIQSGHANEPTSPSSPVRRRGYAPHYLRDVPQVPGGRHPQQHQQHQQQQQQQYRQPSSAPPRSAQQGPHTPQQQQYSAADYLDDSISAEQVQAEADRQHQASFGAKIDTLANVFPGIERETLEIVLLSNGEDVERSIEGLLEMS